MYLTQLFLFLKKNFLKKILLSLLLVVIIISCSKKVHLEDNYFNTEAYQNIPDSLKTTYLDSLSKLNVNSIDFYFKLAEEYYNLNDYQNSFIVSNHIFKKSIKDNDSLNMGRSLYYMGDCFEITNKDSAYYYYKKSENIFRAIDNKDKLAKVYFNKGYILFYEGIYTESEVEIVKALKNVSDTNYRLKFQCYSLQGGNLTNINLFDEALKYFQLAHDMIPKLQIDVKQRKYYEAINIVDLANVYDKKSDHKSSIALYESIDFNFIKNNFPELYPKLISNYNYSRIKSGDVSVIRSVFENSNSEIKLSGSKSDYLFSLINIGEYYVLSNDKQAAIKVFQDAMLLSKDLKLSNQSLEILKFLIRLEPNKANTYAVDYINIYESLMNKQNLAKNKFARIEYESSQLVKENKKLSNKLQIVIGLTVLILLIVLLILFFKQMRDNKLKLRLITAKSEAESHLFQLVKEQQHKISEAKSKEQNRIAAELHDGVMNKIFSIRLNLGLLNNKNEEQDVLTRYEFIKQLQQVEKEVRDISHNLGDNEWSEETEFRGIIEDLVLSKNGLSPTVFHLDLKCYDGFERMDSVTKFNIYRILQELLSNVIKYAEASNCWVKFSDDEGKNTITVKDDGVGFEVENIKKGSGIKNTKTRLKEIKGSVVVNSNLKEGTFIKIKF